MYKALFLVALATGCSTDTPLDIEGTYTDEWGSAHVITSEAWTIDAVATFEVLVFSNEDGFVVAHNGSDNEYSPDLYSRFDWQDTDEGLFYCQTVFDGASQEAAESATPNLDLDTGCGGFAWTNLTPPAA